MPKYDTTITIEADENIGTEDSTEFEIDVTIDYKVHPGEKRTHDYPGSPPEVEILSVAFHEHDVWDCERNLFVDLTREMREKVWDWLDNMPIKEWFDFKDKLLEVAEWERRGG